jgi:predicted dehydrogenase
MIKNMKLIIIGAGRMGMRHAIGASNNRQIGKIVIFDISENALVLARKQIEDLDCSDKISFCLLSEIELIDFSESIAIIASPAKDRQLICHEIISKGVKEILIEKPLGQSFGEVLELSNYIQKTGVKAYVNLNMRLYESFISLKKDLMEKSQYRGYKIISINTGSIGIGANGIHYLDMLYFLFDADDAKIFAGEIEKETLPSGRGPEYIDFGGWCTIKFFKENNEIGRAHVSITAQSSVFGNWDIITPFGQIIIDEISQRKTEKIRKEDSNMPIQRYGADFLPPVVSGFNSPFLGDLTSDWIDSIINGKSNLPNITESLKVHQLMFDWLSLSRNHEQFPIT